jgi:hypothetical protein
VGEKKEDEGGFNFGAYLRRGLTEAAGIEAGRGDSGLLSFHSWAVVLGSDGLQGECNTLIFKLET